MWGVFCLGLALRSLRAALWEALRMKREAESWEHEDQPAPKKRKAPERKQRPKAPSINFEVGEDIIYVGEEWCQPCGEKLLPGIRGTVRDSMQTRDGSLCRVSVKFPQLQLPLWCVSTCLKKSRPCAFPFEVNQQVFFLEGNNVFKGKWGQVAGAMSGGHIPVRFHGASFERPSLVPCLLEHLRLHDFQVKDSVYFVGDSHRFPDGDKLMYGSVGRVVSTSFKKEVCVKFEHIRESIAIQFKYLSRKAPEPLPRGFKVKQRVFYIGASKRQRNGMILKCGISGLVVGAVGVNYVRVRFPRGAVSCSPSELSCRAPKHLTASFKVGQPVFFVGGSQIVSNDRELPYGSRGRALSTSSKGRIRVQFPETVGTILCLAKELSCYEPGPLPGGLKVSDGVYFVGDSHTWDDGDAHNYGSFGKVVGGSSGQREGLLCVRFDHNRGNIDVLLEDLSRAAPEPLPGGFQVYQEVYLINSSQRLDDGNSLAFGSSGKVVGAGRGRDMGKVRVQFEQGVATCHPKSLTCTAPAPLFEVSRAPLLPSPASSPSEPEGPSGDCEPWSCSRCTFLHHGLVASRTCCEMCEQPRGSSGVGNSSSSSSSSLPTSFGQEALAAERAKARQALMVAKRLWKAAKAKEANLAAAEDANLCSICLERPKDCAVVPCGHICGCEKCLSSIQKKSAKPACPVCRCRISSLLRTFRS